MVSRWQPTAPYSLPDPAVGMGSITRATAASRLGPLNAAQAAVALADEARARDAAERDADNERANAEHLRRQLRSLLTQGERTDSEWLAVQRRCDALAERCATAERDADSARDASARLEAELSQELDQAVSLCEALQHTCESQQTQLRQAQTAREAADRELREARLRLEAARDECTAAADARWRMRFDEELSRHRSVLADERAAAAARLESEVSALMARCDARIAKAEAAAADRIMDLERQSRDAPALLASERLRAATLEERVRQLEADAEAASAAAARRLADETRRWELRVAEEVRRWETRMADEAARAAQAADAAEAIARADRAAGRRAQAEAESIADAARRELAAVIADRDRMAGELAKAHARLASDATERDEAVRQRREYEARAAQADRAAASARAELEASSLEVQRLRSDLAKARDDAVRDTERHAVELAAASRSDAMPVIVPRRVVEARVVPSAPENASVETTHAAHQPVEPRVDTIETAAIAAADAVAARAGSIVSTVESDRLAPAPRRLVTSPRSLIPSSRDETVAGSRGSAPPSLPRSITSPRNQQPLDSQPPSPGLSSIASSFDPDRDGVTIMPGSGSRKRPIEQDTTDDRAGVLAQPSFSAAPVAADAHLARLSSMREGLAELAAIADPDGTGGALASPGLQSRATTEASVARASSIAIARARASIAAAQTLATTPGVSHTAVEHAVETAARASTAAQSEWQRAREEAAGALATSPARSPRGIMRSQSSQRAGQPAGSLTPQRSSSAMILTRVATSPSSASLLRPTPGASPRTTTASPSTGLLRSPSVQDALAAFAGRVEAAEHHGMMRTMSRARTFRVADPGADQVPPSPTRATSSPSKLARSQTQSAREHSKSNVQRTSSLRAGASRPASASVRVPSASSSRPASASDRVTSSSFSRSSRSKLAELEVARGCVASAARAVERARKSMAGNGASENSSVRRAVDRAERLVAIAQQLDRDTTTDDRETSLEARVEAAGRLVAASQEALAAAETARRAVDRALSSSEEGRHAAVEGDQDDDSASWASEVVSVTSSTLEHSAPVDEVPMMMSRAVVSQSGRNELSTIVERQGDDWEDEASLIRQPVI